MKDLGVVIIGRNEGERLIRCLSSIPAGVAIVYVDSGSSDDSVTAARDCGAKVVQLDDARPFTAARARNAGRAILPPDCEFVQFVDGDCVLQVGWLNAGRAALGADGDISAVFGRRREVEPGASPYNWLCDVEWAVPAGPALYFGGDVMLRLAAFDGVGGYPETMIAGEEPDLAIRMRIAGWRLMCLPHEMTLHDAAINKLGQWWRRAQRSGHAFAELASRHRTSDMHNYSRRVVGALFWGAALPVISSLMMVTALIMHDARAVVFGGMVLLLPLAQLTRIFVRAVCHHSFRNALTLAVFLMLSKSAQSVGIARYWFGRMSGTQSPIIEYKETAA